MNVVDSSKRRTLKILASVGGAAVTGASFSPSVLAEANAFQWHGTALGAKATLAMFGVSDEEGSVLLTLVNDEIQRLENIFSLYRIDSTISQLNRSGRINNPPAEMVRLLSEARAISEQTGGAFDVTVQPLWDFYSEVFPNTESPKMSVPDLQMLQDVLLKIDYQAISVNPGEIAFNRDGMSITLNGIAQGFITDRIADLLRDQGLDHVLIDLGETRVLDSHPSGRPWRVGIKSGGYREKLIRKLDLSNQAIATSAGNGNRFDTAGEYNHLFDPATGRSRNYYEGVTVIGPRATIADGLSTGLYNLAPNVARSVVTRFSGYSAFVQYPDGATDVWG